MEQKDIIETTYKDKETVDVFDDNRKRFLYQRYKHKIESNFLIDTVNKKIKEKESSIKVLDVACGTGRMFKEIANIENVDYFGVDTSEEMMSHLKKIAKKMKVNAWTSVGDALNLPYEDNTFDVTFTYHLTWHLPQELQLMVIKEMMRVTKPDGYILFDILNENFIWEKSKHLFGKKKLETIYKIDPEYIEQLLIGHKYDIEKLSDFPIKNSLLYSLANIVNISRSILPMPMFHMLYFRVRK